MNTPSNPQPNFLYWKLCAWTGPLYCITIVVAWAWIAKFLPPPLESWGAQETYQFYLDNSLRIRLGMMLTLLFTPLYYTWGAIVSRLIARAEGPEGVMGPIQLMGCFGTVVVTWGSCSGWLSAAFDTALKSPQDIKAVADWSWMWFNATVMVSVTQFVAFGAGFLPDKRREPLVPVWFCWLSLAMGGTLFLALLTPLFRDGPWAWHGLLTYYVGLGDFFIWIIIASYYVFKAIARLEREARAA